jgi:hypothetical protein
MVGGDAPSFGVTGVGERALDNLKMSDGSLVVRFLRTRPSVEAIAAAAASGIRAEARRVEASAVRSYQELDQMALGLSRMRTVVQLIGMATRYYTMETGLYSSVNTMLREWSSGQADEERERNLGLFAALLREAFCVEGGSNPLEWKAEDVYRGARLPIDVIMDYARCRGQRIFWQGFTSASMDPEVVAAFQPTMIFHIQMRTRAASPGQFSVFAKEAELVLSPYQEFRIEGVEWDDSAGCWVARISAEDADEEVKSWLVA